MRASDRRVFLSDALWRRAFGGEPMLGRTVMLNGEPYEVVGIAPPKFQFPEGSQVVGSPRPARAGRGAPRPALPERPGPPGGRAVRSSRSQAALAVVAKRLEAEHPQTNTGRGVEVKPFNLGFGDPVLPQILVIWQVAAVLVMLIACVNVANLILARGAERQRELALRMALGAGRGRILRQLLTEGVVMALAATALSMPLMALGARVARENMPAEILRYLPGWDHLGADWRTLAFSAALALVAAALFSAIPALRATRALRERRAPRRRALVHRRARAPARAERASGRADGRGAGAGGDCGPRGPLGPRAPERSAGLRPRASAGAGRQPLRAHLPGAAQRLDFRARRSPPGSRRCPASRA